MTDTNSKATSKPYSLYPAHIDYVADLAARLYEHNESAALRAMIDFYRATWGNGITESPNVNAEDAQA